MPDRYHIHVTTMPGRFRHIGKFAPIDWREDCSRCTNCVKLRCQYDSYKKEYVHNRDPLTPIPPAYECKACLSCVQGCTKGLLSLSVNPEFLAMGDDYWKPDMIATTWNQSDAGKIPVSGAGYRGRFHGFGFDSIWTDMSEIVRPTRDGIHGREYIATTVDIGQKPLRLSFSADGRVETPETTLIEIQIPLILDLPPWTVDDSVLSLARAAAAVELKTLAVLRADDAEKVPAEQIACVAPLFENDKEIARHLDLFKKVRLVEIADAPEVAAWIRQAVALNPKLLTAVRLPLTAGSADRVAALVKAGVRIIHCVADLHGCETGVPEPRHIKDVMREIHGRLITDGIRDEVTLIVSGGIALAEHTPKAIICGADLVGVDATLLVSLGCTLCHTATSNGSAGGKSNGSKNRGAVCPAESVKDVAYATQRMINLMGAWHSQLIEVLGAMGIREVRRLRGEVGRAIFREDIEREAFSDLIRK
jgi:ferredoxin